MQLPKDTFELADQLREIAQLHNDTFRSGYEEGYRKGLADGLAEASRMLAEAFPKSSRDTVAPVKPLLRDVTDSIDVEDV